MTINRIYPAEAEQNKKMVYALTKAPSVSVKDIEDNTIVTPLAWCLYTDVNSKGKEQEILAIMVNDEAHTVLSTISPTFKREFFDVADLMQDDDYQLRIMHGVSKSDKEFVTCAMVYD